jgi:hypothetical protein
LSFFLGLVLSEVITETTPLGNTVLKSVHVGPVKEVGGTGDSLTIIKISYRLRKTILIPEKEIPMPRKPRTYLPGLPSQVVQRSNHRTLASSKKALIGFTWIGWVMQASDTTSLFMPLYG